MEKYDVAIVGLGVFGSAAAWQSTRKNAKTIAFEQYEFGHVRGASHDTSRIVRTAYDAPEYVALAKAAYKDWAVLEEDAGVKLLTVTGGIVGIQNDDSWISGVRLSDYTASLEANHVPFEVLSAEEVQRRWPMITLRKDESAVYTADTGMAHAAKTVMAMQFVARSRGAVLKENTTVNQLILITQGPDKGSVIIKTSKGDFQASKVILAADAWINTLLEPLGTHVPIQVMQEQVTYFKPQNPNSFSPGNFPVWIRVINGKTFYGFPTFGEPTIKAARDLSENIMTPEDRTYVPSPKLLDELTSLMDDFISDEEKLEVLRTVTCQYAVTPNRQFVLAALESHPSIFVALGAGHGFKFGPVVGRVMAELAIDGRTTEDLCKFGIPQSSVRSNL